MDIFGLAAILTSICCTMQIIGKILKFFRKHIYIKLKIKYIK